MKTIGVLFGSQPRWLYKLYPKEWGKTRKSFILFQKIAEKKGFNCIIGIIKDYEKGKFKTAYKYDGSKFIKLIDQKVDVFFDRAWNSPKRDKIKKKLQKEIPLFNNPILNIICWDKYLCSKKFGKFMPKTYLINDLKELRKAVKKIKTEKIVIKPNRGIMGNDVVIRKKDNLPESIPKNMIVQDFIDASDGIKKLGIKGVHDLRIVTLSGKIDHAYVRKPRHGLITNIAQGGYVYHVKKEKIPQECIKIVGQIDKKMKKYGPRLYTVDFMFNKQQKPIVTELESTPVIDSAYKSPKTKTIQKKFISNIIDNIVKLK